MKKISYYNKETPFEIKSEEDWKNVKNGWYLSYRCSTCGEKHVKVIKYLRNAKNTCTNIPYCNKETPFEIKSEEDWKNVKIGWYVSYICNKCGEKHVKIVSNRNRNNTCYRPSSFIYRNKETPFEIQSEEDWKNVKIGWYVSYICDECGEKHVKRVCNRNRKNTCIDKIPYCNKETPFEIKSEEDWKKVKSQWYVSYICNECGEKHVKRVCNRNHKNTCISKILYRNKETPFEIKSEEDWKNVKNGWYVSYRCNKCRVKHTKKITGSNNKNTCIKKFNDIKINYRTNNVDRFIFAY